MGFDIAVDDRDDATSKRKSQMVWLGAANNYENCNLWGRFKLVGSLENK
ncbi:MAG: hypothetical protein JXR78_13720 [Victivallales bacterium]|nr:hypothetical protein [Victivallales bacterium]